MRTIRLDYLQDAEHRGHHLDREISNLNLDLGKFHPKQQAVLRAFQSLQMSAPEGLEMVAAFAVETLTKDGSWHFGDNNFLESKAGMCVLADNHMCLWLRDEEHRAVLKLAHFFHTALDELLTKDPKAEGLQDLVCRQVAENLQRMMEKKRAEVDASNAALGILISEERRLVKQYLCLR